MSSLMYKHSRILFHHTIFQILANKKGQGYYLGQSVIEIQIKIRIIYLLNLHHFLRYLQY